MITEPMNQISISAAWAKVMHDTTGPLPLVEFAEAIIAARDAQWEQMLNKAQDLYTLDKHVQNSQEFIHDPAEIRRVFEIDEADYPHPDSGFAKL